ncbi:hypothetical protein [Actinotalea subterranea]|uniref:hypothetical protein n=1 Tax=Actinotalea subterranea TaxID=2607497 RepID=UPI0011ECCB34|nr:hypothetical protein [Actinotalea subterranea]
MTGLLGIALDLYGLTPDQFTSARKDQAKAAREGGDRVLATAVGALRRPSTAAWVVNTLLRERPGDVGRLLELGSHLLAAQASVSRDELRSLNRRQHEEMRQVVGAAGALAAERGVRFTRRVAEQVEGTLRAAMSDPDAAAAVLTGLLVRDLRSTGLEPVDVAGACALDDAPPLPGAPARPTPMRVVPDPPEESAPATAPGPAARGRGRTGREPSSRNRVVVTPGPARAKAAARRDEDAARTAGAQQGHAARTPGPRQEVAAKEAAARRHATAAQEATARRAADEREEAARRRSAAAREDLEVAQEQEARAVAGEADADGRLAEAAARADSLASRVDETTAEVERLTELLRTLKQEARTAAVELRHARAAQARAADVAAGARRRTRAARTAAERLDT